MINTDRSVSAPSLPPQAAPEADVVVDPGSAPALERRALFESVVTYANDVVLVTEAEPLDADAGGPRVLYVNPAFTRMTGYAPHEIIGRTPRILQSSATDRTELARLRAALQAWEPAEVELLNVRKDGTEFWVQLNITPVADETGHITHWIAIQRDITVRKRRELSLRGILDGTSDLLVVLNEGRITAVSSVCPRVLGFEPDELRGKPFINLVHPTSRAAVQAFVVDAAVHSVGVAPTLRARVGHRDGTWRWLDLVAADLGGRAGADVVISCVDVTDRVRVEEELAATNERFRSAFDDAPIGMAMTSLSGRFLQVNNALCALLGRSVDEMLSLTVLDITHPEDVAHTERQRQALTRGSHDSHRHETRFLHSDDTVVGILHSSSVVRDPQGVPTLLIDHIENITDRQAFEARLQHQALHDTLTGLPNRALFMDRLDRALTTEGPDRVALLFCDVDRFKTINDTFGHHAGDLVLTSIAQRLQSALRATDTVARLGGDELIVLCTAAGPDEAQATAERLRDALREPIAVSGALIPVTISIGIALSVPGQSTAEQLLRASDDAMYAAKGSGRNQYAVHDEVHSENARRRLLVQASLPHAIDRGNSACTTSRRWT
ncbi:PAS domain S-box protein [Arthrobacter agilis]|uniref:sensor domain-containing protein n=1 Tax=Arthrobacter agilis TaxID=37921 RepID=UPI0036117277